MDHIFKDNLYDSRSWIKTFNNISVDNYNNKWLVSAMSKSSLKDYVLYKRKPSLESYLLCKLDFYGAAIKFKARSNTLPLNSRVHSWKPDLNIICPICNKDTEDLKHFLFICSSLNDIRADELRKLEIQLLSHDLETFWSIYISSNLTIKLCLMLGMSDETLSVSDDFPLLTIFDVFCKSYL